MRSSYGAYLRRRLAAAWGESRAAVRDQVPMTIAGGLTAALLGAVGALEGGIQGAVFGAVGGPILAGLGLYLWKFFAAPYRAYQQELERGLAKEDPDALDPVTPEGVEFGSVGHHLPGVKSYFFTIKGALPSPHLRVLCDKEITGQIAVDLMLVKSPPEKVDTTMYAQKERSFAFFYSDEVNERLSGAPMPAWLTISFNSAPPVRIVEIRQLPSPMSVAPVPSTAS